MPNIILFGNYLVKFIYINQKCKQLQFEAKTEYPFHSVWIYLVLKKQTLSEVLHA